MDAKPNHNDAPDGPGLPSVNISTVDKRWISHDLQILRSGLLADAEIVCEGDSTPRKVHRSILAGRSAWFRKAFTGGFKEAKECKVNLQETPWRVDLMLYFFYTGGINWSDEVLTSGHDVMDISVEVLRLGDFFQSTDMRRHGESMLLGYLRDFLIQICLLPPFPYTSNEGRFNAETNFPQRFCAAIVNAFDEDRPVKLAQNVLADFAFAARIHLFKNTEFMSFIRNQVVPEFGNLVLEALMTGSVSGVFNHNHAFRQWQDWRVTPRVTAPGAPSPQAEVSSIFGKASLGVASGSGTAPPRVVNGYGTSSAEVSGLGLGRGNGSGGSRGGLFGRTTSR
ncbi:hypothetical protein LA080_011332 [Diaporthe eres]|uniref:BTB domain-containing protein n=1 Tax=Diaporthe vaccinii TaxID=105482 RepID=A0ABR4E593_9PEZI|nr:hypothetical protein LA080_011332 [Diaporthe eres]